MFTGITTIWSQCCYTPNTEAYLWYTYLLLIRTGQLAIYRFRAILCNITCLVCGTSAMAVPSWHRRYTRPSLLTYYPHNNSCFSVINTTPRCIFSVLYPSDHPHVLLCALRKCVAASACRAAPISLAMPRCSPAVPACPIRRREREPRQNSADKRPFGINRWKGYIRAVLWCNRTRWHVRKACLFSMPFHHEQNMDQ